jgi:hypothetical protein
MFASRFGRSLLLVVSGLMLAVPGWTAAPSRPVACADGATRLCLLDRFEVEASWSARGGRERAADALPISAKSGAFSFFGTGGTDLLVQVRAAPGGTFAVRLGALTDAAFELHVVDTRTGATWSYEGARGRFAAIDAAAFSVDGAPAPATELAASLHTVHPDGESVVADLLEKRGDGLRVDQGADAETRALCRDSATDLCLLGGRFRVQAVFGPDLRQGAARPAGDAGESGMFSFEDLDRADLAVRMVDGTAVNGSFWLLASTLGDRDVTVRATDLESGRVRELVLTGGAPSSRPEVEAFSAAAATVQVTLDTGRALTQLIGPLGGSIQLADAQGTRYVVAFPPLAIDVLTEITVTPVTAIAGLPFAGGLKAGVRIEPEGLLPAQSVMLTITPAAPVPANEQLTFAFRGVAGELFLSPPRARQAAVIVPIHRLGGFGLAAGSPADLAAQLLRFPSREEDRFAQRLAGLLLPLRRAGNLGALPSTVLQLLQGEFSTAIKPQLVPIQQGLVQNYLPLTWSFRNSVTDTGLTSQLKSAGLKRKPRTPPPLDQIKNAEIAAARQALNKYLLACTGAGGVDAAFKAFGSYSVLKGYHALGATDTARILNCVNFELRFDTDVESEDQTTHEHDIVLPVHLALTLDLAQGRFWGTRPAPQTVTYTVQNCTTTEVGPRPVASFNADKLLINRLEQFDEGDLASLSAQVRLYYGLLPPPQIMWNVDCSGIISHDFTTWVTAYAFGHVGEIQDGSQGLHNEFYTVLSRTADPRKVAERLYHGSDGVFKQDTSFILLHTPR